MASENERKVGLKRCIFGCTKYISLRYAPRNDANREDWRRLLNLKFLRKNHTVCDKHFQHIDSHINSTKDNRKDSAPSETGQLKKLESLGSANATIKDPFVRKLQLYNSPEKPIRKKCVLLCKNFKTLHKVPLDDDFREQWRLKLNLKELKKSHRVCSNHFKYPISTRHIRSRELPDSPERKEEVNQTSEIPSECEEDNWCMEVLENSESPIHEDETVNDEEKDKSSGDESLDDDTIHKLCVEMLKNSSKENENYSLNWGVLGEEIGPQVSSSSSPPKAEELYKNLESELARLDGGDTKDSTKAAVEAINAIAPDDDVEENHTKRISLTIERIDTKYLERHCEDILDDNDYDSIDSDVLEGQFRAIDNDSLIVNELEDQMKCAERQTPVQKSKGPIYVPSRSHALQSWLKTSDFSIVRRKKS